MPVIGFVRSASNGDAPDLVDAFRQGLKDGGFIDGKNLAIEIRSPKIARINYQLWRKT